jgi:hypothetical protein
LLNKRGILLYVDSLFLFGVVMNISVKGVKIKLLDLSMIRRYGNPTPLLDPSVAKILVNKGLAIYVDKIDSNISEIKKIDDEDLPLFSKEIIGD